MFSTGIAFCLLGARKPVFKKPILKKNVLKFETTVSG